MSLHKGDVSWVQEDTQEEIMTMPL